MSDDSFWSDHRDEALYSPGLTKKRRMPRRTAPYWDDSVDWVTSGGQSIRLEDLTPKHRGNIVRMLERRADGVYAELLEHAGMAVRGARGVKEIAALAGKELKLLHQTPLEAVRKTPLVKRLIELGTE